LNPRVIATAHQEVAPVALQPAAGNRSTVSLAEESHCPVARVRAIMFAVLMKAGFRYAVSVVIAALVLVILFQQRNMSRLRNHMSRLQGDARALNNVLGSNAISSAAAQEQLRRLQRENEQLREEVNRVRGKATE
jgi:hypothetical protein